MKRYVNLSMAPVNMAENEAGEWVQYSEVKDLEEQNTENERIINSLYGSSESKVLEELKIEKEKSDYWARIVREAQAEEFYKKFGKYPISPDPFFTKTRLGNPGI